MKIRGSSLRLSALPRLTCEFLLLSSLWGELLMGLADSSDKYEEQRRVWGGGLHGNKSTQMVRKRANAAGQSTTAASLGKL